ncbi:MAG: D-alanyl-D-alanine carboxypeptidase family protein [Rickettsiales bacterium]
MFRIFVCLIAALVAVPAVALETKAKQAIVIEDETGAVLFEKSGYERMFPSSMTKMMTAYITFKQLKEGKLTPETKFTVSEKAWRQQGSKMFVELGNQIPLMDLLRGVVIQSGNDACITLAEGIAGSEEGFAGLMNEEAKVLGMKDSHFMNSDGWPDENHYTTANDLAILARATVHNFPDYYSIYGEREFTYHGIRQHNRNLLLGGSLGVDGLKTGHTEIAGYGITVSAKNADGRRVFVVVNGLTSEKERAEEAASLVGYAFGAFENKVIRKPGEVVATIPVWLGVQDELPVTVEKDVVVTLPKVGRDQITFTFQGYTPVAAPVQKGAPVGTLVIKAPGISDQKVPLVAGADIAKAGFMKRLLWNLTHFN